MEAPAPVDDTGTPAVEALPHQDAPDAAPVQAAEVPALPPDEAAPADVPSHRAEPAAEPEQASEKSSEDALAIAAALPTGHAEPAEPEPFAEEPPLQPEESPASAEPSHDDQQEAPADFEAPLHQDDVPFAPEQAVEADTPAATSEQAATSLVDAIDQWSADNTHPDGRVEPSLDTPGEHLVVASLDDAHHLEDLPPEEQPAAESPAAEAEIPGEPSFEAEPWSTADAATGTLAPGDEPWSLSESDETALHAVAAVNTDAPDDGASVTDDEPAEQPARSRRERALKRAKARRDASGPAAEHDVFAIEEDGGGQTISDEEAAARMRAISGVDESAAEDLDHSDLNFVKRVDRSQKYGKAVTITMAVAVPILLAGLVLQAATTFRDTLAANYPQLKPALTAVCQPLGCKIALPTQLDALSVEPGELASMTENTFSFSTVLRNQSKTPQAWPHVELTLNDNADKPVLRRVFTPGEYLPSPAEVEKGFAPRSEQSIKLYFELKELKASGYHIAIFYP